MNHMINEKLRVGSGVAYFDRLLGGLFVGDNVVWHDESGILAGIFCLNLMLASQSEDKAIVYVCLDRSPRNLLEKLGPLAEYPHLVILDCFTCGKGASAPFFLKFYDQQGQEAPWPCRIVMLDEPHRVDRFEDALYGAHSTLQGDVRFIFDSLTTLQELWGGEEQVLGFYSQSCPRLYELNTIAYWILEKRAHSDRLRARINQVAQVAIDLSVEKGTASLTILKAENRGLDDLHKPHRFWVKDLTVTFKEERKTADHVDLGLRLKEMRIKRGLSQTEFAGLAGVPPVSISQFESGLVYPSLPELFKMADVLSIDVTSFFLQKEQEEKRIIFTSAEATDVEFPGSLKGRFRMKLLTPVDLDCKGEPCLIEIPPGTHVPSHFFVHKGEEMGYLLSGRLQVRVKKAVYNLRHGDLIHLGREMPLEWRNPDSSIARLLWIRM
jgi:transcriptional regulator with XRE-family HTH domain